MPASFSATSSAGKSAADIKTKLRGRAIVTGGKGTAADDGAARRDLQLRSQ